jgi:hypothetical protein
MKLSGFLQNGRAWAGAKLDWVRFQWQPTTSAHDPSPPITLEDAAAGGATITADLAATEAKDVAAFSAALVHVATLASTEAPDTAAFSAALVHTAALAVSEGLDVAVFSATLVHAADLAATEAPDVAAFTATLIPDVVAAPEVQPPAPAGRPSRDVHRRLYIMPDGRMFKATTDEVLALLQLYAVPKETIEQLTAPLQAQPVIRAPQITLQKRDVRFVPAEHPNTYKAVISERFVYRAPPDATGHAQMALNRIRADEEAILALLM